MMAHEALMLWVLPLLPLGAGVALVRMRHRGALLGIAVVALLITLALALWAASAQPAAKWAFGPGMAPAIAALDLGRVLIVLVPIIALPVVVYAATEQPADPGLPRLLALLVAFCGAMELLLLATDFLTLLVAWELVGACSWALIAHDWRDATAARAGRDAFLTTRAGDLGLYLAAAAAFAGTGSLAFDRLDSLAAPARHIVAAGVLLAAAAKSAQVPFSPWLFAAMRGPTAASALLHSATMVAAGAYLLARLSPQLASTGWLLPVVAGLGLATALAGGAVATLQRDLKKALAGSTSAQYGLMLVAVGAGFPAVAGLHLVTHAAFKALLFLGAGVATHVSGTLDLERMRLGRAAPGTAVLFALGTLALAGVPPLGAAYSKDEILAAASQSGEGTYRLVAGVLLAAFLSALYAGRLQLLAFGPGDTPALRRPRLSAVATIAILALLSVALGLLWLPGVAAQMAFVMGARLPDRAQWPLVASLASVTLAGLLCWLAWRRKSLLDVGVPLQICTFVAGWFALPQLAHAAVVAPATAASAALARFDDRVVDAGIRLAAGVGDRVARIFAGAGERSMDALVQLAVRATDSIATRSTRIDVRAVDGAVEWIAQAIGAAGARSRRLQTGLLHEYYALAAVGLLAMVAAGALALRFLGS